MQFLFNDGMSRADQGGVRNGELRADQGGVRNGELPAGEGGVGPHAVAGISILLVMAARLWLRLTRSVPPSSEPGWMKVLSRANHWAFCVILLAMQPVGLLALLTLGTLYSWAATARLGLIGLHVAGAALHALRRDGTAQLRMLRAYADDLPSE